MTSKPVEIQLSKSALVNSVRDEICSIVKSLPKPFAKMSEAQQTKLLADIAAIASDLCLQACDIIASDGAYTIEAGLGKVGINAGTIEGKISVERTPKALDQLGKAAHGRVRLSFVNYEKFTEETDRPEPDADQIPMFGDQEPSDEPVSVAKIVPEVVSNLVGDDFPDHDLPPADAEKEEKEDKPKQVRSARRGRGRPSKLALVEDDE